MKHASFALAVALSAAACINLQVREANFQGPTPQLGLSEAERVPMRIAVVVPDPMGARYYYTPPAMAAGGARRMDQTDQMRGTNTWGTELARLSGEAFSAAFTYAAVLRHLPAPGEYDAVVEVTLTSIDQQIFMSGMRSTSDIWLDWKMSVLDNKNIEVFSTSGTLPKRSFNVKAEFSAEGMIRSIEEEGGRLISQAAREAVLAAHAHLAKGRRP